MKLRNKKTGEIKNCVHLSWFDGSPERYFETIEQAKAELEDWEDCNPTEPLIKDEKIRKAVKAWADVNKYDDLSVYHDYAAISFYNEDDNDNEIIFNTMEKFGLEHLKCYTVTELCGSEE